ncbi:MAG: hypothetical protein DM484_07155 [Candidatus Methylumidiphilus alinenensis]|uniref:Uncharacterized protein n=1 Tax=Candidatus Methylumidiphilus alinenensis TaxID=2202197 RepID=A0A2W4RH58_9GAMM|nr:MAG: hypothetical protein DM484_07155 [Candidatus Methylumidiphilus alinenensis]
MVNNNFPKEVENWFQGSGSRHTQDRASQKSRHFGRDAEMTSLKHLCMTRAPAWEPLPCKLLLGRSSGSWSFKNPIPKQELGNEQNNRINELTTL